MCESGIWRGLIDSQGDSLPRWIQLDDPGQGCALCPMNKTLLRGFSDFVGQRWMDIWWAHQDSNLEPKDSHCPGLSLRCGLSHHPQLVLVGCGTLKPVIKGTAAPR